MHYDTKFALGDQIYAVGQPQTGCRCPECQDNPATHGQWNVLGVSVNKLERFDPLTIEGIMILPGEEGQEHSIFYAVRELPGELLPEARCYVDLHEAGQITEVLNSKLSLQLSH